MSRLSAPGSSGFGKPYTTRSPSTAALTHAPGIKRLIVYPNLYFFPAGVEDVKTRFAKLSRKEGKHADVRWDGANFTFFIDCAYSDANSLLHIFLQIIRAIVKEEISSDSSDESNAGDDNDNDLRASGQVKPKKVLELESWKKERVSAISESDDFAPAEDADNDDGASSPRPAVNYIQATDFPPEVRYYTNRSVWIYEGSLNLDGLLPDDSIEELEKLSGCKLVKDDYHPLVYVGSVSTERVQTALRKLDTIAKYSDSESVEVNHIFYTEDNEKIRLIFKYLPDVKKKYFETTLFEHIDDYHLAIFAVTVRCCSYNQRLVNFEPVKMGKYVPASRDNEATYAVFDSYTYPGHGDATKNPLRRFPTVKRVTIEPVKSTGDATFSSLGEEKKNKIETWANEIVGIQETRATNESSSKKESDMSGMQGNSYARETTPSGTTSWDGGYVEYDPQEVVKKRTFFQRNHVVRTPQSQPQGQVRAQRIHLDTALADTWAADKPVSTTPLPYTDSEASPSLPPTSSSTNKAKHGRSQPPLRDAMKGSRASELQSRQIMSPKVEKSENTRAHQPPSSTYQNRAGEGLYTPVGSVNVQSVAGSQFGTMIDLSMGSSNHSLLDGPNDGFYFPILQQEASLQSVEVNQSHTTAENQVVPAVSQTAQSGDLIDFGSDEIVQVQATSEVKSRVFHLTMNKKRPKPSVGKAFGLGSIGGSARGDAVSRFYSGRLEVPADVVPALTVPILASDPLPTFIAELESMFPPMLEQARGFRGTVVLEAQFGRIAMAQVADKAISSERTTLLDPDVATQYFVPNTQVRVDEGPQLMFTEILTTMPADVNYLLDMTVGGRMWEPKPSAWYVEYEFICEDTSGVKFTIVIDAETMKGEIRDPRTFGSINVHGTLRRWDYRIVAAGYARNTDLESVYGVLLEDILSSIFIPSGKAKPEIVFEIDSKWRGMKLAARVRRTARYSSTDKSATLKITEVHKLSYLMRNVADQDRIVYKYDAQVKSDQIPADEILWYEARISSVKGDALLAQNQTLELGEETTWTTQDFVNLSSSIYRPGGEMLKQMDGVGFYNDNGCAARAEELLQEYRAKDRKPVPDEQFW